MSKEAKADSKGDPWGVSALSPELANAPECKTKAELFKLLKHQCPGGVTLPLLSAEGVKTLLGEIESIATKGSKEQKLLDSLDGLLLGRYPKIAGLMNLVTAQLNKLMAWQKRKLWLESSFAIRYSGLQAAPLDTPKQPIFMHGPPQMEAKAKREKKAPAKLGMAGGVVGDTVQGHFEHNDWSDITVNLNIGKKFVGGDLLLAARRFAPSSISSPQPQYECKPMELFKVPTRGDTQDKLRKEILKEYKAFIAEGTDSQPHYFDYQGLYNTLATLNYYPVKHASGQAIVHAGKQQHMAEAVKSGERVNVIIWFSALLSFPQWGRLSASLQRKVGSYLDPLRDLMSLRRASKATAAVTKSNKLWTPYYVMLKSSADADPRYLAVEASSSAPLSQQSQQSQFGQQQQQAPSSESQAELQTKYYQALEARTAAESKGDARAAAAAAEEVKRIGNIIFAHLAPKAEGSGSGSGSGSSASGSVKISGVSVGGSGSRSPSSSGSRSPAKRSPASSTRSLASGAGAGSVGAAVVGTGPVPDFLPMVGSGSGPMYSGPVVTHIMPRADGGFDMSAMLDAQLSASAAAAAAPPQQVFASADAHAFPAIYPAAAAPTLFGNVGPMPVLGPGGYRGGPGRPPVFGQVEVVQPRPITLAEAIRRWPELAPPAEGSSAASATATATTKSASVAAGGKAGKADKPTAPKAAAGKGDGKAKAKATDQEDQEEAEAETRVEQLVAKELTQRRSAISGYQMRKAEESHRMMFTKMIITPKFEIPPPGLPDLFKPSREDPNVKPECFIQ